MADSISSQDPERTSLLSTKSLEPRPETLTKVVNRLRALTFKLLPVQVDLDEISAPTSRIITPKVIDAYMKAAGDFTEALPYCLLRARQSFVWDANHNAADYDEHMGRAVACEVLARRITHKIPTERLSTVMSTRFRHREWDGDKSNLSSTLESAIDQHCSIFLSSTEAQHVVNQLWRGDWIQINNENNDIDYVPYEQVKHSSFTAHLDPSRLGVPRYQNSFRIAVWFFFLFVYYQAVRQPLDKLNHQHFDEWEGILYTMALAFTFEDLHKVWATVRLFTWKAFTFWTVVSLIIDSLLITAFSLRVTGLFGDSSQTDFWHLRSFQVLSCVSPFIWTKLITVFDGFKYVGTMQICVSRMLQESAIFFVLLSILGIGFAQGMYALDASDGETDRGFTIINTLLQALLQAPDFEKPAQNAFGLILYYLWNLVTTLILLNVLISLFSSAYQDVVDDAEAQFLAFFASKTVSMIRAPDSFVYPAPFNLVETFLIAPLQPCLSRKAYEKINRVVMTTLFFIPLACIAFFESQLDTSKNRTMRAWFEATEDGQEDDPECQNPNSDDDPQGTISTVKFEEIILAFPNTAASAEATLMHELHDLKRRMDVLLEKLEAKENY